MHLIHSIAQADFDGDSQMRSSSSSDDSDAMFPAANEPPTTQTNSVFTQLRQADLSPPSSQDPPDLAGAASVEDAMDITEGVDLAGGNDRGQAALTGEPMEHERELEKEPGYAWKNVKAREEYQRAMDSVVDKHFSLRTHDHCYHL